MVEAPPEQVVTITQLVKGYGQYLAVNGVSLAVNRGEIFGILGPNGAGKTTLLEMVAGLREPTSGTIRVYGLDPLVQRAEVTAKVSIQPQSAGLFDHLTVRETLELFAGFYENALPVNAVLTDVGLAEKQKVLVKRLSGGQRHRLLVGVSLIGNADLLFLDEPTGSLDPQARRRLWDVIQARRNEGKTIILTTHSMEEAEALCNRIAIMQRGKVLALGEPQALIREHLPEQMIAFECSGTPDADELKRIPGVVQVFITGINNGASVRVRTTNPDETLRTLLSTKWSYTARGFRMEQGTLEDLFLLLVGERRKREA